MADSDEEYSHNRSNNNSLNNPKKNRDKFHRERDDSSSNQNQSNNQNNYRRDWNDERNRGSGGDWKSANRGNYQGSSGYQRKYQSSPSGHHDSSPPPQKRRKDWENPASSGHDYSHHGSKHVHDFKQNEPDYPTQPPFLSFKLFLQQQDDNITDEEAIKKYNDYKTEFKRTQINNFFLEHKEEEWFKLRYHPDENYKRRNEQNQNIINRLEVFMDLLNKNWLDDVSIEMDKSKELTRFLDACVIKLEGGNHQDIKRILDGIDSDPEESKAQNGSDQTNKDEQTKQQNGENGEAEAENDAQPKSNDSGSESGAYTDSDSDDESKSHKKKKSKSNASGSSSQKQLHKTASIFMRNLAPSVSKQDLENLCKQYDGFKRVALSDPAPERGFFRRGWITFDSNVDVKKICWNLQNIKIKDSNPGAIVNRELTNRIRPINNLVTYHKSVVKNDIKLCMKIIQNMDKKWNLWQEKDENQQQADEDKENEKKETETEQEQKQEQDSGVKDDAAKAQEDYAKLEESGFSKLSQQGPLFLSHRFNGLNPLLRNITDYLVEEASAEEEELLGDTNQEHRSVTNGSKSSSSSNMFDIEIDKDYNKVLDKLVLYLRVVHSIDFYNSIEYQQEDSMPNRCGIMFVRPSLPSNAASASLKINQDDINQYIKQFESKMKPYVDYKEKIDLELAKKLGIKERKEEIEKFIKLNTQELAPDRWLCPLSGKRFKGPEFIRKHLFYKHMEKIIEVKKEVEYFNNYVLDPKRPQLPEHPSNKPSSSAQQSSQSTQSQSFHSSQMQGFGSQGMMGQSMMGSSPQLPFGQMPNRPLGQWQSGPGGYMQDMMQGGYGPNFNPSFGSMNTQGSGFHQGFKKQGFAGSGGSGPGFQGRRGGNASREMIQYKDLDAPDE